MTESFNVVREAFKGKYVTRLIDGFPYLIKSCRFCKQELLLIEAVHIQGQEEIYKTLYFCENDDCPAYDEPARKQYAKVYYSCEDAYERLETLRIMKAPKVK